MSIPAIVPGKTRLGWIGTGVMGKSMVGHLIDKGFSATVYNRSKAKAQPSLDKGAKWADTVLTVRSCAVRDAEVSTVNAAVASTMPASSASSRTVRNLS